MRKSIPIEKKTYAEILDDVSYIIVQGLIRGDMPKNSAWLVVQHVCRWQDAQRRNPKKKKVKK